jgi:hypothetical protein
MSVYIVIYNKEIQYYSFAHGFFYDSGLNKINEVTSVTNKYILYLTKSIHRSF